MLAGRKLAGVSVTHFKITQKKYFFGNRLLYSSSIPKAVWWSNVINGVCFHCLSQRLALTLIVFSLLADGDGYQDHLLPVCEDAACQHSAIYLAKSGSSEVRNAHGDKAVMPVPFWLAASFSTALIFTSLLLLLTLCADLTAPRVLLQFERSRFAVHPSASLRLRVCRFNWLYCTARAIVNTVLIGIDFYKEQKTMAVMIVTGPV